LALLREGEKRRSVKMSHDVNITDEEYRIYMASRAVKLGLQEFANEQAQIEAINRAKAIEQFNNRPDVMLVTGVFKGLLSVALFITTFISLVLIVTIITCFKDGEIGAGILALIFICPAYLINRTLVYYIFGR
jgi:hypothetical protein